MRLYLAILLLTLAGSAAAETLQGVVVEDHSNRPLASVEVRVSRVGVRQLAADLETDATGHFTAEGLPVGDYRIEASKPNYVTTALRLSGVKAGLLIRLVRCGVISGQVLDGQGQAVRGAAVYAVVKVADGGALRPFDSLGRGNYTRVDSAGQYRLHDLAPGEYALAVTYGASTSMFGSAGGATVRAGLGSGVQFYPANAHPQFFAVAGGEEYRADFAILPNTLYSVRGRVELPNPKTESEYWLALTTGEQPALAAAVTQTDGGDTFEFKGIAPGSYLLTASGPVGGYGGKGILEAPPFFGRREVTVGGADLDGVRIAVQQGRAASFVLRSSGQMPEGACPPGAQLTLTSLDDWATKIDRTAEVNFRKEQRVEQLAPARYQMELSGLGESCYQAAAATLDLTGNFDEKPVVVLVAPAGSIHGKLTGTASPADFAVALVAGDAAGGTPQVQVVFPDGDGRFGFAGLRPGVYRIGAQPSGEGSKARWVADRARMIEIRIAAGGPTEMELPAPPINPVRQEKLP